MGSIDDLLHSLLIRPEEQEGWEVRETEGERQGRRGGGEREGRITRRGQRRLLGDEGDYDEREREKKGEACFLCISPRSRSRNQHPSIQDSHLPLDREPIAPATYPSAQPLK